MLVDPFERLESNVRVYCRQYPTVFARGVGSRLIAEDGREYLDFLSGAGSLNYGHNNPHLQAALLDYLAQGGLVHSLDLHSIAKRDFLLAFEECILQPRNLRFKVQFVGPTGTNAVEAALKLARKVTGRRTVAAFTNAFHGVSLGALAATANGSKRRATYNSLPDVVRLPYDGYFGGDIDTLPLIEKYLTDPSSGFDLPAALIIETVQGEGGLNAASKQWLQGLCALAKRLGILVIIDDIQAGCGRTGTFFSFEGMTDSPDMVCLSKSIGGFGLPMAIMLMKPELDKWEPGEHNGTFRGNNLAFVTAAAALKRYWSDSEFQDEVTAKAALVTEELQSIVASFPGFYRKGRGLMQGLCCQKPGQGEAIVEKAFSLGMVIETCGPNDEIVKLMPSLTIEEGELRQGLQILRAAVESTSNAQNRPMPVHLRQLASR